MHECVCLVLQHFITCVGLYIHPHNDDTELFQIQGFSPVAYLFMYLCIYLFWFLGPHPWHMEVPSLGVKLELQLPAYTPATATAPRTPSRICDLHQNVWQCQILNPLGEARDRTHILADTSHILNPLSHNGPSSSCSFIITPPSLPSLFPTIPNPW